MHIAFHLPLDCLVQKPLEIATLAFIYVLPSMVSSIPYLGIKKLRLGFDIFCSEIGKSFKWSIFF
jgi:hypothetical protein